MIVGVDIGGTKIAYAVIDAHTGVVHARAMAPTDSHEGAAAVLARMESQIRTLISDFSIEAIGVGVPGVFDDASGHTRFLPNLMGTWPDVPVAPHLRAAFGVPVWLINDARAFVLAEAIYGAGRGHHNVAGFTLGTGIGGGLVIHQQLYLGIAGTAGEFGHQTLALDGPQCGCGNYGCLEAFASGPAMVAQAHQLIARGEAPMLAAHVAAGAVVTPAVLAEVAPHDAAVAQLLHTAFRYIGAGVANVVSLFSPTAVILGGSVANLGDALFATVRHEVTLRCRATPVDQITIMPAALGGDAGMLGAACWAAYRAGVIRPALLAS
jgi:glucokinase